MICTTSKHRAFPSKDKYGSGEKFSYGSSHGVWVGSFVCPSKFISPSCHSMSQQEEAFFLHFKLIPDEYVLSRWILIGFLLQNEGGNRDIEGDGEICWKSEAIQSMWCFAWLKSGVIADNYLYKSQIWVGVKWDTWDVELLHEGHVVMCWFLIPLFASNLHNNNTTK